MKAQRTHYEVLGIERTATPAQIKAKYHDLARLYHPDRASNKITATRLFVQINMAYRVLKDTQRRAHYDDGLRQAPGKSALGAAQMAAEPSQLDPQEEMNRARAAYFSGDRNGAHSICMAVLASDSSHSEARVLVGDIYVDRGKRTEALAEYKAVATIGRPTYELQQKISRIEAQLNQANGTTRHSVGRARFLVQPMTGVMRLVGVLGGRTR